jgi:hypothetical protein
MRRAPTSAIVAAALLLAAAAGCGGGQASTATAREGESLRSARQQLDRERRELARLRGQLSAAAVGPDGAPLQPADAALAADVERRDALLRSRSAQLGERLVRHLGRFDRRDEEARQRDPQLAAALRMKSDEDIEVAQEWIDRGGDYRRAIEILETQRRHDPGYERLEQALQRARAMRFVTAERLARIEPGMTAIDVRATLGPANLREVLRRPAEGVEAWFYPRAGGGRAAVYFRYDPRRQAFVVFQTETAVVTPERPEAPPATVG